MRLVKGVSEDEARRIEHVVAQRGRFDTLDALWRASGVSAHAMRKLAAADAFNSMGLNRQAALWHVRGLSDEPLPLFEQAQEGLGRKRGWGLAESSRNTDAPRGADTPQNTDVSRRLAPGQRPGLSQSGIRNHRSEIPPPLPPISQPRKVVHDYNSVGLSLKAHPVSFLRGELDRRRVAPAVELRDEKRWPNGRLVRVAGLVLVRQRPGTASGVVFETIEDETGIANLIIRPRVYERYRRVAKHSGIVMAQGKVERQGLVVHVMVERMEDLSGALRQLVQRSRDFR